MPRFVLRKILPAAAAVCCCVALVASAATAAAPSAVSPAKREPEQSQRTGLWARSPESSGRQLGEDEEEGHRRALTTVGVPGEGLLLAAFNSDEDAIDEFGHEEHFSSGWHKDLLPLNS